jgi:hypothetical protein
MKTTVRLSTSGLVFLAGMASLGIASMTAPSAQQADVLRDKLERFSTLPMLIAARELGVTNIQGKDVDVNVAGSPGNARPKKLRDVGIGVHPTIHENEPTVAANPTDKKTLVAGSHYLDPATFMLRCLAYRSDDRGATWSAPFPMPQLTRESVCSDPVLAYAPDGSRVYYAYMDIKPGNDWDIVVSYSNDDGQTWIGPIVVLDALPGFLYDKPWIGTHVDDSQSAWVYVTATQFSVVFGGTDYIAFTRSANEGLTWSAPPTLLDSAPAGSSLVVQGSRPAGGVGSEVLVAWYNSAADGWLTGSFEIRTRRSPNHGASFDPVVVAAVDGFEAPFWLGPMAFYHRWWGSMFPDVEIDPGGEAHLVYAHDPVAGSADEEDGDIRYVTSAGPPYTSWSSPLTLNDDGLVRAQGYAALETQHGGQSSTLHVIWEDHRLSPTVPVVFPDSSNLFYDIFSARKVPGQGVDWSRNFRVSDASSINDFLFIGDYNDLTATNILFGVWTDRRDKVSIFDLEDDVYGSRVKSTGSTP